MRHAKADNNLGNSAETLATMMSMERQATDLFQNFETLMKRAIEEYESKTRGLDPASARRLMIRMARKAPSGA